VARYTNLGYLVLGEVVAAVSGMPYEQYVREQVLRPLGIADTGFGYAKTGTCPAAVGYQRLPRVLTPVLRAALPAGIVAGRR